MLIAAWGSLSTFSVDQVRQADGQMLSVLGRDGRCSGQATDGAMRRGQAGQAGG